MKSFDLNFRCYGNTSTWRGTQKWVCVRFLLFSRIIGNPSKTEKCRGISEYFGSVSAIFTFDLFPVFLGSFPLFFGSVSDLQKKFKLSICWSVSPFFWVRFLFFWVHFRFSEKVVNSQFVDRFPLFLGQFPLFFGSVSSFHKKFQILSLLIVFFFFGSVSLFFG